LQEIGYLEPKPGIPPDPDHLFRLIQAIRAEHVQLLLAEDFYNLNTARLVAQKGGAKLLDLPTDGGAKPAVKDGFGLVETILHEPASTAQACPPAAAYSAALLFIAALAGCAEGARAGRLRPCSSSWPSGRTWKSPSPAATTWWCPWGPPSSMASPVRWAA